jgi:hypothetical protein
MRIVLHIGQQRSGTTAIQNAFFSHAAALSARGVLYPVIRYAGVNPRRHHMLATVLDLGTLPRGLVPRFGGRTSVPSEETIEAFRMFARKVERARAAARPQVLVLSSEMLFRDLSAAAASRLDGWFERLGGEATVAAYIRKPSETFASSLWQALYSRGVIAANPIHFRSQLESWRRGFGDRLRVVPFDRARFHGHDVVSDFAHRFVPEIGDDVQLATGEAVNASSSAEIMAVVADIVGNARRDGIADPRLAPGAVEPVLRDLAAQLAVGTGRPKLLAHVASYIDHASGEVTWLRDTFGLRFDGIDYDAAGKVAKLPLPEHPGVSDFFEVDQKARAALARAFDDWLDRGRAAG